MRDDDFDCDDAKAAEKFAKHGVSFEAAREIFKDPFGIERLDDREDDGEERYCITGMVEGRLLCVAYTLRGDTIRIISARGAEPYERRQYHEESD